MHVIVIYSIFGEHITIQILKVLPTFVCNVSLQQWAQFQYSCEGSFSMLTQDLIIIYIYIYIYIHTEVITM